MKSITVKPTLLKRFWEKIKGLDFYLKSLLIGIPISTALFAYLLSIGAGELLFSDWFISLISIPTFIANQLATPAYAGRITDLILLHKKTHEPLKKELIGTLIGVSMGIAVGVGLSVMHIAVPFASTLFVFANVLFTLRQINIFAGLGNRVGKCIDKGSRPTSEKAIVATAGIFGLLLGIALFATFTAGMISIVGVTSFFSGGAAIPVWVAGIIFVATMSSGFASSSDYAAKGISFIRSHFIPKGEVTKTVKERKFEYGGSCIGFTLGLIVGAILIGAIVLSNPFFLVGVVGVVASALILMTCAGIIGSIFSRVGRIIDGFKHKPSTEEIPVTSNLYDLKSSPLSSLSKSPAPPTLTQEKNLDKRPPPPLTTSTPSIATSQNSLFHLPACLLKFKKTEKQLACIPGPSL
jgi:hypothetical protein